MATTFERIFAVVIGNEGGGTVVDNPSDPGGLTRWGVSSRSYPTVDIANLTLDDARAIYKHDFYQPIRGDDLPPPLALTVFDAAISAGVARATRWLQQALGVSQDGIIGPATLAAVQAHHNGAALIAEYNAQRLVFMASLPTWRVFGLGWSRRMASLPFAAMALSMETKV